MKIFYLRDPRIESLMVIGYNPSHTNVNSEVNAPFKILSIFMRYLENENNPKKGRRPPAPVNDCGSDDEEHKGITPGYKMKRDMDEERLDTVEDGDDIDYDNLGGKK
jgi:importin-9